MSNIRRYLKSEFSSKKDLPKNLEFLRQITFSALVEHQVNQRKYIRIEMTPNALKQLTIHLSQCKNILGQQSIAIGQLRDDKRDLEYEYNKLSYENNELLLKNILLEKANMELYERNKLYDNGEVKYNKSPESSFGRAERKGFKVEGLPYQGGSPGLKKKR